MKRYAIMRHGKVKGTGKGVCVAHNRRLAGEAKENIDASLTPLNVYWHDAKVVARINEKLPVKRRKDAVEVVELLLSASPEFFDSIESDRRKLAAHPTFKKWVQETVAWAKKELGKNVVDIALHLDENSPHFHVLFVPLVEGRLCAKEVTSRAEMVRRQSSYADAMGQFGLIRGEAAAETHRKHTPLKDKPSPAKEAMARLERLVNSTAKDNRALRKENAAMKQALATATDRDRELVAEITALRAANANAQPNLEQLRAINAVLVDQARERLREADPGRLTKLADQADDDAWAGFHANAKALRARETLSPTPTPQNPSEALVDAWQARPATGTCCGTIVAVEGRWAVQHIGKGAHVLHQVEPGSVRVGDKATITAGQVTVNAPAERGGHGHG